MLLLGHPPLLLVLHRVAPPRHFSSRPTRSLRPRNRKSIYRGRNAAPLRRLATKNFLVTDRTTRLSPSSPLFPLWADSRPAFIWTRALTARRTARTPLAQLLNPLDGTELDLNPSHPKKKQFKRSMRLEPLRHHSHPKTPKVQLRLNQTQTEPGYRRKSTTGGRRMHRDPPCPSKTPGRTPTRRVRAQ